MQSIKSIMVWDGYGRPDSAADLVVLWRDDDIESDLNNEVISISRIAEERASELRSRYLEWVHALSEIKVENKTIAEHLQIRPGLSYWWMASVSQKCNITAKSGISSAIKLLALEAMLADYDECVIELHTSNMQLVECLSIYCKHNEWGFEWRSNEQRVSLTGFCRYLRYSNLPRIVRTTLSFGRYFISRLSTVNRNFGKENLEGHISFFDVLVHLEKEGTKSGRFVSNYWGPLIDMLTSRNIKTNWFHLFYPHPTIPTFRAADLLLRLYRANTESGQFHKMIEGFLPISKLIEAWSNYLQLYRKTHLIDNLQVRICPRGSSLDLWPLHRDEWKESISGPNALTECLRLGMFEVLLDQMPKQKMGVYISENQPWEISLIYAWKKNRHGKLVAIPHTTVRYWDLRYFHDPITYSIESNSSLPQADYIAVNGPIMHSLIIDSGYPKNRVVEVEALRFMHLNSTLKNIHSCGIEKKILICGDFLTETNDKIFSWIEKIASSLPKRIRFIFKAHPAFPYAPNQKIISKLNFQIDERPLENILHDCNIILVSAITSAGVDAYLAGKRVIQIPSNLGLNVNPLRGINEVRLVRNSFELLAEIKSEKDGVKNQISPYFNLDPQLTAWQKLISNN